MSIKEFLNEISAIAKSNRLVNWTSIDDVYSAWQSGEIKYPAVNFSIDNIEHIDGSPMLMLNLIIYYGDRLLQGKSNLTEVYNDAERVLNSTINRIFELNEVGQIDNYTVELWDQQFVDYLAGGYVRLRIGLINDMGACSMDEVAENEKIINLVENGKFYVKGFDYAQVDVEGRKDPVLQSKDASAYANSDREITADEGYDGLDKVTIKGIKAMDAETTITQNGIHYVNPPEGYEYMWRARVNVNIPLIEAEFTENGEYAITDGGWTKIRINVVDEAALARIAELEAQIAEMQTNYDNLAEEYATYKAETEKPVSYTWDKNAVHNIVVGHTPAKFTINVRDVEAVNITQAEYDALTEKDPYKIYLIIQ